MGKQGMVKWKNSKTENGGKGLETSEGEWTEATAEEQEQDPKEAEAVEAKPGQLELRPQMLQVMKAMSEYGYLTMAEIQFVYGNKTWSYRHLKLLREQGVIADFDTLMSPRTAHYLTARGYRVLGKAGQLNTGWRFRPERYTTFSFRHRMACAKAGLVLERHSLVHDFLPEIRLWKYQKRQSEKICDGEFWYRVPGRELMDRVGLEVELTLKNRDKQEESFRQFARRKLAQVWWLCGDETIIRALRRQVLDRRRQLEGQRHYFVLLEDFLAAKGRVELMDADGALFSIDADKPTLPTAEPERPPEPAPLPPKPAVAETHAPVWTPVVPVEPPPPSKFPMEPIPLPSHMSLRLAEFRAVTRHVLDLVWDWVKGSWTIYWGSDILPSITFHRWPHVCALASLALSLVLYRYGAVWLKATNTALNPPPKWSKRRLRDAVLVGDSWRLYPLALHSMGGRYRFKLRLENDAYDDRKSCGVIVTDLEERPLARQKWSLLNVPMGHQLAPDVELEFRMSRSMDRFFVVHSGCDVGRKEDSFPIQFR